MTTKRDVIRFQNRLGDLTAGGNPFAALWLSRMMLAKDDEARMQIYDDCRKQFAEIGQDMLEWYRRHQKTVRRLLRERAPQRKTIDSRL